MASQVGKKLKLLPSDRAALGPGVKAYRPKGKPYYVKEIQTPKGKETVIVPIRKELLRREGYKSKYTKSKTNQGVDNLLRMMVRNRGRLVKSNANPEAIKFLTRQIKKLETLRAKRARA